jgi:hypothetical protein
MVHQWCHSECQLLTTQFDKVSVSAFCDCKKYLRWSIYKEESLFWLTVLEVTIHAQLALVCLGSWWGSLSWQQCMAKLLTS